MYVCELDRPWHETPFMFQGFLLKTEEDIQQISQYCAGVWVDPARQDRSLSPSKPRAIMRRSSAYKNSKTFSEEASGAQKAHSAALGNVFNMIDAVRMGVAFSSEAAKDTVTQCVESIMRNPNAMMFMSQLKKQDDYTAEHCLNVAVLAIAFGRHLQFIEEELHNLGMCALLHDFGKIRIPNEILNKPSRLTNEEMRVMQQHTVHGRNLLASQKGIYHGVVDVAYSHHERIDGTGYPRKLPASGISEFSRIVSIVDAYDAMTSDRVYAPGMSSLDSIKILLKGRDKQFDGKLVQEFIKCIGVYPPGNLVELRNGIVAIVVETNYKHKRYPRIIAVRDVNKDPCKPTRIDLSLIESGKLNDGFQVVRTLRDGSYGVFKKEFRSSTEPLMA